MNLYKKTNCSKCKKTVEQIDLFSSNLCLNCYELKYEKMEREQKTPNFNKLIN